MIVSDWMEYFTSLQIIMIPSHFFQVRVTHSSHTLLENQARFFSVSFYSATSHQHNLIFSIICLCFFLVFNILLAFNPFMTVDSSIQLITIKRERSGSVVERLTRDRGAVVLEQDTFILA